MLFRSARQAKAQTFALLSLQGRFAVSARPALQEATRADISKAMAIWPERKHHEEDSATEAAVRAFQRDHSLTVDGIAGKATQEALYAAESAPHATYTVTLRNVPQADAIALTAKYGGEMVQTEERTA